MSKISFKSVFLGLAVLIMAASCAQDEDRFNGNAMLNISLVDAPADYDEVWIEVVGVEVLPNGRSEDEGSAWISIPYTPDRDDRQVDLLTLVGDQILYIGSEEVPAGRLSQIRLLLGDNNYIVIDGERFDLTTPSAQQSGLKLQVNKDLQAGIQYDMMLDFDADRSIVRAGNSGQHILKPVIRVITEESATIRGKVLPIDASEEPVLVHGILDQDTVSTFTDHNGVFMLRGLANGAYQVDIHPQAPYASKVLTEVAASRGEVADLGELELELEAAPEE
ncbi:DUF4382 domain-containing protein [Litoribacter populi]|uniref:DUF4382 domain-containing protein n=1 Tax=Litoribacter populi TaxID=2598460 RepID=UPI00117EA24D|nr:DUF4382 domain-containing protein [Litoribacter populi]